MRTIIIPTDFSENAFNALKYAVELFKYEKCDFFLLHAYAEELYEKEALISEEVIKELKENGQKTAQQGLEKTRSEILKVSPNPHHRFHTVTGFGLLVDEVNCLVNKQNADMCIMGTRGKSGDHKTGFGSNTLQVLKYLQCPVLCIPDSFEFNSPKKLLFPTNFMIPYTRRELKILANIAGNFSSEIHMLYISKTPVKSFRQQDNKTFLEHQLMRNKLQFHIIDAAEKVNAIQQFSEKMKSDMLVMVNSRKTYLEHILYRSTLDKIGLNPKIPFLVLQNFHRG